MQRDDATAKSSTHRRVACFAAPLAILSMCAALASCSNPPESPWLRAMPLYEREAWPTRCGIPEGPDIGRRIEEPDVARKEPRYHRATGAFFDDDATETPTMITCGVAWDLERDRMWFMWIAVAFSRPMTEADTAPYVELIARELNPRYRDLALQVARGPERTATLGDLRLHGGFEPNRKAWTLWARVPPIRKNEKGGLPTDK